MKRKYSTNYKKIKARKSNYNRGAYPYPLPEGTKAIALTKGHFTLVDEQDFSELSKYNWFARVYKNGKVYACRKIQVPKETTINIHRQILNAPYDREVDHINGNALDNRRCNIRLVTRSQNNMNKELQSNNTSGYRGVYWNTRRRRWVAAIQVNGKSKYLGAYSNPYTAHQAYLEGSKLYHGDYGQASKETK